MSVKRILMGITVVMMVASLASVASAAATPSPESYDQAPAKEWHEIDTPWMKKFHNPAEGIEMGLDLRLREVYARNIFSADDQFGDSAATNPGNWNNYHWQRYRTRLSTKVALSEDVDFNARLTWEFWGHCAPDASFNPFFSGKDYDFDEAIFDTMNVKIRNAFDMPLTLTIGRQDIILGTGWLVLDGTPADGSRTIFFDAVRGTYDFSDATKLDLIYIQQYDDEDKWLKPFNHGAVAERRHLTQYQDEKGLIFYLTNKTSDALSEEVYYIYKKSDRSDYAKSYGKPAADTETHTIGTRLYGNLNENWSYSAELAKQWGRYDEGSMTGLGSNSQLTYAFNDDKQSKVFVGYEYLSGDDPGTSANEKFDTLWGDWPQYQRGGDLQSYIWTAEGALGEVANLHRLGFGYSFKPGDKWTMLTQYNLMWADQNTFAGGTGSLPGAPAFTNDGNFRGQMITGLLTYQCCQKFRTQFLLDYFMPGNYYQSSTRDDALFARINMEWTF